MARVEAKPGAVAATTATVEMKWLVAALVRGGGLPVQVPVPASVGCVAIRFGLLRLKTP